MIERGNLGFSAAHFITMHGGCEPLHGHNYGVQVEISGALTADSFIFDFITLKNIVRSLCKEWDHCVLLPLHNPHLRLVERQDAWEVEYDARNHYVLAKVAVTMLEVDNVTTERLAELLARRIAVALRSHEDTGMVKRITVGIQETEMQTAFFSLDFREASGDLAKMDQKT
ncbi:MAG: 6-pyruvoyl tetrahydropterin synthase family protein [Ktedonobacterales bacterium]|nr:MAG: 6-pyruvoyl tetrahydropterin synthase family protein [Ktedonobacterales bacterium]